MIIRVRVHQVTEAFIAIGLGGVAMLASWATDGTMHELFMGMGILSMGLGFIRLLHLLIDAQPLIVECRYCKRSVPEPDAEPLAGDKWVCERCLSRTAFPGRAA